MTHYPFQSQNIVDINRISGEDKHFTAKQSCVSSIWSVKTNYLRRESTKKKLTGENKSRLSFFKFPKSRVDILFSFEFGPSLLNIHIIYHVIYI